MKSSKEIRNDLANIRIYYTRIRGLCAGEKMGVQNHATEAIVEQYNEIIKNAPAKMYDTYCGLYIEGHSIESWAEKLGFAASTVSHWNCQLVAYLKQIINQ